ncbi:MAG: DUF4251 domain-containing protein [Bacteroidales bacterium]|nr:DUF4251 domain-containing protein [Bacteroidales bacterium]
MIPVILSACSSLEAKMEEIRKKREQKIEEGYEDMREMAFSGLYEFTARHVIPSGGYPARDISGNRYFLSVNAYDVTADLPFFGTQYMPDRSGRSGVSFEGQMKDLMIEESDSRHRVLIRFSVDDESDNYIITLDISPSGDANLTIYSSKRSTITYVGKITPITPDEE